MRCGKAFMIVLPMLAMLIAVPAYPAEYVGSEKCSICHMEKYNDWVTSGHPYKLRPASVAKYAPVPLPAGYTWNDISYLIGGFRWKARYIDKKGYIITTDKKGNPMPTQWNIATGRWVDYHPGEKTPYKCGPCHMTGYSEEGHQGGLEGIVGSWALPGIHCEECHGPGGDHSAKKSKGTVKADIASALCGKCHVRGEVETIPSSGGFIQHHEQYNEYLASPHRDKIQCVTCHDPHKPARFGIRKACGDCHGNQLKDYEGSTMQRAGIACKECHMPKVTKSAEAISKTEGDVRTHNWRISIEPEATMFTEDGKYAKGILTLDVVCLNCHGSRDVKWAVSVAKGIHSLGKAQ